MNKAYFGKMTLWKIIIIAIGITMSVAIIGHAIITKNASNNTKRMIETEITAEEKEKYRNMIGNDMDIKKTILVMFDTEEECKSFIASHGADKHPEDSGLGKVPLMENGYFNIGGKQELEEVFDNMSDGEYSGEPVMYAGMYCYIRRVELYSPLKNDKDLEELIRNEKALKKEGW